MRVTCVGSDPSRSRVRVLEAGLSRPDEMGQEAEVLGVFGSNGDNRDLEVTPDDLGDVADLDALLGHPVEGRSGGSLLEGEAEDVGGVEPVDGRPAVSTRRRRTRNTLVPGDPTRAAMKPLSPSP